MKFLAFVILIMNNDIKKVGRPKGPKRVAICRRVDPELVAKVDSYIDAAIESYHKGNLEATDRWLKETYGFVGGREPESLSENDKAYAGIHPDNAFRPKLSLEEAADKVMKERSELMLRLAVSEKEDQIKALLEDIQRLTDEIDGLRGELYRCQNLTYDEKMAYWKARVVGLEEQIRKNQD